VSRTKQKAAFFYEVFISTSSRRKKKKSRLIIWLILREFIEIVLFYNVGFILAHISTHDGLGLGAQQGVSLWRPGQEIITFESLILRTHTERCRQVWASSKTLHMKKVKHHPDEGKVRTEVRHIGRVLFAWISQFQLHQIEFLSSLIFVKHRTPHNCSQLIRRRATCDERSAVTYLLLSLISYMFIYCVTLQHNLIIFCILLISISVFLSFLYTDIQYKRNCHMSQFPPGIKVFLTSKKAELSLFL